MQLRSIDPAPSYNSLFIDCGDDYSPIRVLNLYSGIGGNRQLWKNVEVTSVEYDKDIAEAYSARFPQDNLVVGDAVAYLEANANNFDFIWASPPCQSHGQYRHRVGVLAKGYAPLVPDMTNLYGVITFLKTYYDGLWVVENTVPYYEPLIPPTEVLGRHLVWSNFSIGQIETSASGIRDKNKISDYDDARFVMGTHIKNKRQVLRNQVSGETGKHVLDSAMKAMNERVWIK
jgi:DNA (cytosine-5)-methyltransferase 1